MKAFVVLSSLLLLVSASSRAFADPEPDAPPPPVTSPRYDLFHLEAGLRVGYVPSRGFDTFAKNDVLAQFSLSGTAPLLVHGRAVLSAGVGWDTGGRSGSYRGFDTTLAVNRLSVPIEGRYYLKPWVAGFVRVAPGAAAMHATIDDGTTGGGLSTTAWAFSADLSAGASILITPRYHAERRAARIWVTPEIGYALTTSAPLSVGRGRDDKDVLGSDQDTKVGALALGGVFWRTSVGVTF